MSQFKTFKELAEDTREKVLKFGISKSSIKVFDRDVKKLDRYFTEMEIVFSKDKALSLMEKLCKNKSYSLHSQFRRTILLLNDNFQGELKEWKMYLSSSPEKPEIKEFQEALSVYRNFLKNKELKQSTINRKLHHANEYLLFQERQGLSSLKMIDFTASSAFFNSSKFENRKSTGVSEAWNSTRHFLEFLEEYKLIDLKLSRSVPVWRASHTSIPTPLSKEVQEAILQDFPDFPANKRDKAMYILCISTGLRWSDVTNLKFPEIDWINHKITIIQKKTDVPHSVFLTDKAAEALKDYILHERRECDLEYVFITSTGPIKKFSDNRRCNTSTRLKKASPTLEVPSYGSHVMRDTFASNMFDNGAAIKDIYASLGHTDPYSVDRYLSIKEDEMKECALELDMAPYTGGLY